MLLALAVGVLAWLLLRSQAGQASAGAPFDPQTLDPYSPLSGATGDVMSAQPQPGTDPLSQLATAVGKMEGYGIPGAIPTRDNNPGDLTKVGGGFLQFGDVGQGWAALKSWLTRHVTANPNWDFYDLFNFYLRGSTTAPPADAQGDSNNYAEFVAGQLGVNPSTPVSSFLGSQS